MPSGLIYNFFGSSEDLRTCWQAIEGLEGMRFFEASSQPDMSPRMFQSFAEAQTLSVSEGSFAAWPSHVGGPPRLRYVAFTPDAISTGLGRTFFASPAMIQIVRCTPPRTNQIGPYELFYFTEASARKVGNFEDGQLEEIDWLALKKTVSKIKQQLKAAVVSNWRSMPVLPGAAEELERESKVLWFLGKEGSPSPISTSGPKIP